MADLINNNLSYTTKNETEWFYQVLKKAHTLEGDYVRVIPNVTKKVRVKKLVMADNTISQADARDCAWTPKQRIAIDGKEMDVENFKINEEQCLEQLDSVYSEEQFNSIGATKDEFPQGLEEAAMFMVRNSLSNDVERILWGGSGNAVDGKQNGIIDKALADSNTIKVSGVTLSVSNIVTEIQKVYDAIPNSVLGEGEYEPVKAPVRIFVSVTAMRYLKQALSTVASEHQVVLPSFTVDGKKIFYLGVEIVTAGIPTNVMVAGSRDNLVFLTDLLSDTQEVKLAHGNDLKDENMVYIKGAYRASGDYIFSEDVVIYA